MKTIDLTGQQFGKLTVLERDGKKCGQATWKCRCECDNIKGGILGDNLRRGATTTCGCSWRLKGEKHPRYSGCKDIRKAFFNRIRCGAKSRKLEFSISIEYIYELFDKQNKKCALSNKDIFFVCTSDLKRNKAHGTASLDRIDSSRGYIEGNVQWVHKDVNKMKTNLRQDYFIELCKMIASNQ